MADRDLTTGDLLFVLKRGFVYGEAKPATREGFYKYVIECETPNSNGRSVRAVVVPDPARVQIKIITVMWADE